MAKASISKFKLLLIGIFVAVQLVLYALFLAEDFGTATVGDNEMIKYAIVLLSLGFSAVCLVLFGLRKGLWLDSVLLTLGLALTAVSDWFLLITGTHTEVGVTTFILAQLCYAARIRRSRIHFAISAILRALLPAIVIIVLYQRGEASTLYVLAAIYFIQLVLNFAENTAGILLDRKGRIVSILLAVGFALFIGCDVCVGMADIFDGKAILLVWVFYAPSQILIGLSNRGLYEKSSS